MPDFMPIQNAVFDLYQQGKYSDAIQAVERAEPDFPEMASALQFWKLCLYAAQNKTAEAIATLRASLDSGNWYREAALHADDDLKSLQGIPEFEALVEISKQRQDEAQARVTPYQLVIEPEATSTPPYSALVGLHGNNNGSAGSVQFWKSAASHGFVVALPQSTQIGIREGVFVWDEYEWAKRDVLGQFTALKEQTRIDEKRVILGGFSMGGQTAIRMVLDGSFPAAGFIGVAPWMGQDPDLNYLQPFFDGAKARGVRGVILIGENDEGSIHGARRLAELLTEHGIEHRFKVYPGMAHAYPSDFAEQLQEAARFILR